MEQQFICNACGQLGKPDEKLKGNFAIEFILWWFFIVPGIIYSYWRRNDKDKVCASCGNKTLIPANTPMGKKLLADTNQEIVESRVENKTSSKKKKIIIGIIVGYFLIVFIVLLIMA
jgi:hypothetical protein